MKGHPAVLKDKKVLVCNYDRTMPLDGPDVCPTSSITLGGDHVVIDPHVIQGGRGFHA